MKSERITRDDLGVAVVSSRRIQDGVEIIEREVHLVTTVDVPLKKAVRPRLVITDALASAREYFISKTRSEVEGLHSLLEKLTFGAPALK